MNKHKKPTLTLNKTVLKHLSLDDAIIPASMTNRIAGGTNEPIANSNVKTQKNDASANTTFTSGPTGI